LKQTALDVQNVDKSVQISICEATRVMRSNQLVIGFLTFLILPSCNREQERPKLPLQSFSYREVHVFSGGPILWVAEDRTAILQIIERPRKGTSAYGEKRYTFKITEEQFHKVEQLAWTHNLLTMKTSDRPGKPDESRPRIQAMTKAGEKLKVSKWRSEQLPDFDAIYYYLLELSQPPDGLEPVYQGEWDVNWRPDGFADHK
jgi:hypothetical protein